MSRVAMLLALTILGSAVLCAGQVTVAVAPIPNPLSITLDQTTQEAMITESTKTVVGFTGNITVQMVKGQRVTVTLIPSVDTGWASEVAPSEMLFTGNDPLPFSVNVTVPENQAAARVGMLSVEARCTEAGMEFTAQSSANITVRPYYRLMLESDEPSIEIAPGGTAHFTVKVWNVGNSVDTFDLGIVELERLAKDGWDVRLDSNELRAIPTNEYRKVNITARSPQDQDTDVYKSESVAITLKATSRGASGRGVIISQSYPVMVHIAGANVQAVGLVFGEVAAVVIIIAVVAFTAFYRYRRMKRRKSILGKQESEAEKGQ